MGATQSELTLARLVDEREMVRGKHESKLAEIATRDDKTMTGEDKKLLESYRERAEELDGEVASLTRSLEATNRATEESRAIRRAMAGTDGQEPDDGVVYRDFYTYARDVVLSRSASLSKQWTNGEEEIAGMRERLQMLKRTPANTLSSNVEGLIPEQHIAQIFQVIQTARPIVASARRVNLERGTLTYPSVTTRPVVAVQAAEKTEAGNTGMVIDMETLTATTYLGGGDISWQAINWSTPSAISLWFDFAASDYALKTEQHAAQVLQHSGFTYNISSTLAALTDFSDVLAAIAAGAGDVYANSGRMADTVYMAPNAFYSLAAIASTENANFVNAGGLTLSAQGGTLAGLSVVVSRGMDTGVIVVGDSAGLLVAETAGAPVELRVVEPAIGGVEVGLIGAIASAVVDPGAFAMITTAS